MSTSGGRGEPDRPLEDVVVLVPRSARQADALSSRLRALGAATVHAPTIGIEPPDDPARLRQALARADQYEWIALTSPNAVDAVLASSDARALTRTRLAVVGPGTHQRLADQGIRADLVANPSTARGLADALAATSSTGRVLLPRADIARPDLPQALADAGWQVDEVEAYRTVPVEGLPPGVAEDVAGGRIDIVAFTSGSTARNLVGLLGGGLPTRTKVVSIGPSTTRACRDVGLTVAVEADPHDLDGLVAAVVEAAG